MDALSAQFLNGAGVVTVVLFVFVAFLRGWFVTKKEADSYLKRAEKAEDNESKLLKQNAELMEMARLGRATFEALHRGTEERDR